MKLREALEKYVRVRPNLSTGAAEQLHYSVVAFERHVGGSPDIDDIDEEVICDFIRDRCRMNSQMTASRNVANIMTILRWAKRRGHRTADLPDIEPVKVDKKTPIAWGIGDLSSIIEICGLLPGMMRDTRTPCRIWWRSLILFLYDSGARISAAVSVARSDVSITDKFVVLRPECSKTGIEQVVGIGDDTADMLRSLLASHGDETVWHYPWHRRKLWVDLHAILKAAGVDQRGVGFHRIRKTHATQVVSILGWEAGRVSLGHTDEKMTRRYVDPRQLPRKPIELPRPSKNEEIHQK